MTKRKLKPFVVPMIYTVSIVLFVLSMYFLEKMINQAVFKEDKEKVEYVNSEIIDNNDYIPVLEETPEFIKPFNIEGIEIVKGFYDYKGEDTEQQKSIIEYENTYMQNCGIDYSNKDTFNVLSSISGKVESIEDNEMVGTSITITNENNIKLVYQSLSNVTVSKGDIVTIGQVIATSGTSKINQELGNHLHFELYVNNEALNPEKYYNKSLNQILEG